MTVTNETGSYVLPNLPIGTYRLSATLPGFKTYAQTGIVLDVNASPAIKNFDSLDLREFLSGIERSYGHLLWNYFCDRICI